MQPRLDELHSLFITVHPYLGWRYSIFTVQHRAARLWTFPRSPPGIIRAFVIRMFRPGAFFTRLDGEEFRLSVAAAVENYPFADRRHAEYRLERRVTRYSEINMLRNLSIRNAVFSLQIPNIEEDRFERRELWRNDREISSTRDRLLFTVCVRARAS